jgi:zinc protease
VPFLAGAETVHPPTASSADASADLEALHGITTESFVVAGVPVILRRVPTAGTVAVRAFLRGGLAYAGPARAGRERLMLDVAMRQTRSWSKDAMARELVRLGARLGATSGTDYTTLDLDALASNLELSLALFASALVEPRLDDQEVALARQQRLDELQAASADPQGFLLRQALENFYGDHPGALDPLGAPTTIAATTAADLQHFHDETVTRSRLLLTVAGNVDRPTIERLLAPVLEKLPAGDFAPSVVPPIPGASTAHARLLQRDQPTVYMLGLFAAPTLGDADYPALYVGMSALAENLWAEIRTKGHLSYAPGALLHRRRGNFGEVSASTTDPVAVAAIIRAEIARLQTSELSSDELAKEVAFSRTLWLRRAQTTGDAAFFLGDAQQLAGSPDAIDRFVDALGEVTPAQVRAAMAKYAHDLDFTLVGNVSGLQAQQFEWH